MTSPTSRPSIPRRRFLQAATAAAAFTIVPRRVLGGPKFVAPSESVRVALIGAGGQGKQDAKWLLRDHADAQVISVCDPYEQWDHGGNNGRLPVKAELEKLQAGKGTPVAVSDYADYRQMLDRESAIDAVICATPDHWHATITLAAMKAGKHVYCEKPLTHNIWEAREVARVGKETGVATQMGNMGHSGEGLRRTCEWIWAGAIGAVREVHAWGDGGRYVTGHGRPTETPPIPAGFDWDLWVGPRPPRPYHPSYTPGLWRGWWAFGCGCLGDMGCHNLDPAYCALHLETPLTVEATSPGVDSEITCYCTMYRYTYGARGDMPPVKVTWYDGGLRPATPDGVTPRELAFAGGNGILFVGDEGVIACAGWAGAPRLFPLEKRKEYEKLEPTLPRSQGHLRDWLDACKGGPAASANFQYGAGITEMVLLGNVALRAGTRIEWDAANMKATNTPKADALLREEYRPGWDIG
ncbi:MAG: Gfo/Idh/MocA family oxidoreductase [Pirellulaceae bacterium]|nr:Gfo/Idh/MocA family oxidoreductase [Pirellulaceae bacterium]